MRNLAVLTILVFLVVGCGGGSGDGSGSSTGPGTSTGTTDTARKAATNPSAGETRATTGTSADTVRETIGGTTRAGGVRAEQISSGAMGLGKRRILIATSAQDLATATGLEVPDSGEGTYVAVFWGEKPTGGYTMDFGSVGVEGVRVRVEVELRDPSPDAMVAQALTYPYAIALLPAVDAGEKEFLFVTQNGREIGWPVRNV